MEALTQETSTVTKRLNYREIADDMQGRIESGEYARGSRLPSYRALADLYGVSFATAARAYGLLRDRGLVYGEPGRAMYVAE